MQQRIEASVLQDEQQRIEASVLQDQQQRIEASVLQDQKQGNEASALQDQQQRIEASVLQDEQQETQGAIKANGNILRESSLRKSNLHEKGTRPKLIRNQDINWNAIKLPKTWSLKVTAENERWSCNQGETQDRWNDIADMFREGVSV